ncbi:MAG TPA: hypothetical protein VGC35_05790 [Allosphingosinicella sp.]|jgi:hypothetical protein
MMKPEPASTARHLLVLDLETRPDPQAVAIAPRGREMSRATLHHIIAYSSLSAVENPDGEWTGFMLRSAVELGEFDLLMEIDASLDTLAEAAGTLVTYNGVSHDLAVLRRRAAAHWMFGLPGLSRLHTIAHEDLFRAHMRGRRDGMPSLRDACAGYGIPTDHTLVSRCGGAAAAVRKSQVDCVATFLLTLYELAIQRGDDAPLVAGWSALVEYLAHPTVEAPHLDQFRWHPQLAAALGS